MGYRFNDDLKAERFESPNESVLECFRVKAIEVVSTKTSIFISCYPPSGECNSPLYFKCV